MNKVVTGSLWATSLMLAGTLAGCGSGASSGDSHGHGYRRYLRPSADCGRIDRD